MDPIYPIKLTSAGVLYLAMPDELSILEDFMIVDLNLNNIQEYIGKIDEVLDAGTPLEITGITTHLTIKKDKTTVYNFSVERECSLDTKQLKDILKTYLTQNLLLMIEKDLQKKQVMYDKAKNTNSLKDILKIKRDLQQDKII